MRDCERAQCLKRSPQPEAEGWYTVTSWDRPAPNSGRTFCSLLCLKMWIDERLNL